MQSPETPTPITARENQIVVDGFSRALFPCEAFHREWQYVIDWFNAERPHMGLEGRTPDEVYYGRRTANRARALSRTPPSPAPRPARGRKRWSKGGPAFASNSR